MRQPYVERRFPYFSSSAPCRQGLQAGVGILLCVASVGSAFADDKPDAVTLDQVTVTSQRGNGENRDSYVDVTGNTATKTGTAAIDTPAAVSVVTEKELTDRNVQNLQQAVAYTSSVSTDEFGSDDRYDYYRIRGFDQTTLGTYRDGLPARIPGWYTASRVEPYGLERLDVLKGSTSSLFGLNSPGGLVNAITKRPPETPLHEAYVTIGNKDHYEVGTDIGGPLDKSGVWSYRVTTKVQKASGDFDDTRDDRLYIAPALTYAPDASTSLTLLADYNKRKNSPAHAVPEGSDVDIHTFLGEPDYNRFNTEQTDLGYQFRHAFSDSLTFRQNARYSFVGLDYREVYGATTDPTADRTSFGVDGSNTRFTIDNQLQYDTAFRHARNKALLGIDYTHDNTAENITYGTAGPLDIYNPQYCGTDCVVASPYLNWKIRQDTAGLYGQDELTLFDKLTLTGGMRYDYVHTGVDYLLDNTSESTTDHKWTSRAGVSYRVIPQMSVYANYSESFQPLVAPTANGYTVSGSLKPQEGTQYEVGVKYMPKMLADLDALFTLAAFDLTQSNVPSSVDGSAIQTQIGKVRVRGLELEGKFNLAHRLNGTLAYSYWDPEITEDGDGSIIGNDPARVPHNLASAWLDYTLPQIGNLGRITVGGGVRAIGSSYTDTANTAKTGGYALLDAMVAYQITHDLSLQVNATNLANRKYISTCYYGDCYYGDGRTILTTLKQSW